MRVSTVSYRKLLCPLAMKTCMRTSKTRAKYRNLFADMNILIILTLHILKNYMQKKILNFENSILLNEL